MRRLSLVLLLTINLLVSARHALATEYFVSSNGNDRHPGTSEKPFQTIQKAADLLQPGDTCTVLAGIYREWVTPPRGGASEDNRIVYRAAPGQRVVIRGSEPIEDWEKVSDQLWKTQIPNKRFGDYNPFAEKLSGEFITYGDAYHMGDVYLNGRSCQERFSADEVAKNDFSFFAEVDADQTVLIANFSDSNPNEELIEVNARPCVFFPKKKGLTYITVEGFVMQHAAANWACFRAFQHAAVGTYYGRNWIIQNNTITDARCAGIVCGNDPSHQDEGFDLSAPDTTSYETTSSAAVAKPPSTGSKAGWPALSKTI